MNFSLESFLLKGYVLCVFLLLSQISLIAQDTLEIAEFEYFFDTDPGFGSATSISLVTPDTLVASIEVLNASSLSVGFHILGFRARNTVPRPTYSEVNPSSGAPINIKPTNWIHPALLAAGDWGTTETKLVYVDPSETGGIVEVDALEYFFDLDPGVGSATAISSFTTAAFVSLDELLTSNSLEFGFHSLGMRAKAVGGSWGMTETKLVFVDQSESGNAVLVDSMEYFFDVDPGVGSATIIDGFTATTLINFNDSLVANTLESGFHSLGMRAKAVGGSWGTTETRLIFVDPSSSGGIINVDQIEYFFDVDPGVGSATSVSAFAANDLISLEEVLNTSSLNSGFHVLGMRARAEGGSWGPIESRLIYVDNAGAIQSNIVQFEYFIDDDPGFGAASSIPVSVPDSSVSESIAIDISGLPLGTHNLHVRALNDVGEWGLIETDTFLIGNIGGPVIASISGDTTNATPINLLVSFDRQVVGFDESDINAFGNGRVQSGSFVDNADGTYNFSLDSLTEGEIELYIPSGSANALDDSSPTPASDTLRLLYDITAPQVTVDSLLTSDTSPALSGTVNDTLAVVEITLSGVTYTAPVAGDSTWALGAGTISPSLAEGVYDVEVTATDIAGNMGVDATTDELIIDTSPPIVTVNALTTSNGSPELTGTVDEPTITLDVEVNGNSYPGIDNGDSTWTLPAGTIAPALSDGVYEVVVTATDGLGNVGVDVSVNELTIDNVAPVATVNDLATSIRSPELSGAVYDLTATISVEVDGNAYAATNNGDSTWMMTAGTISPDLIDGVYDVIVTVTDVAGNVGVDTTTNELIITTDILATPATAITSSSFEANWSTGIDELAYLLDISTNPDFSTFFAGFENFNAGTAKRVLVSPLDFGTEYYYRVRMINSANDTLAYSNVVMVTTSISAATQNDIDALTLIYNSTSGAGWTDTGGWLGARLQDWSFISLNANQRVSEINLSANNLVGFIPPISVGLEELATLNLSDNRLDSLGDIGGLVALTNLNVSGNQLDFDDLEPVVAIAAVDYSNQGTRLFEEAVGNPIEVRYTSDFRLSTSIGGSDNQYQWFKNGQAISNGSDFSIEGGRIDILSIDFDKMGEFSVEVTSPTLVPGLSFSVDPQLVYAIADMNVEVRNGSGALLSESLDAALMETTRRSKGFDTLEVATGRTSAFTFPDVVLGNYILGVDSDPARYVPTYFSDAFEWTKADTIFFRNDEAVQVAMTDVPTELGPNDGDGTLQIILEEDFGEDAARIDARRRAARRKCGLKKQRSGGRVGQDDDQFDLIAYGETNDNGEFEFGFLPFGVYRFFVEYPGIPLDESAFVQFEVGEAGISDTDFKLEAFASEEGIEITIVRILGVILDYFKNLEVYPNPTTDWLKVSYRHLKSSNVRAEIVDLSGKNKWSMDLKNGFDGSIDIDVSDYQEGAYILRFYDRENAAENVVSYRIIIQ